MTVATKTLLIDAHTPGNTGRRQRVTVTLTDRDGVEVEGFDADGVVVEPVTKWTDSNGELSVALIPQASITTPLNSCYTVQIGRKSFLIQKSTSNSQSLESALVTTPDALGATAVLDTLSDVDTTSATPTNGQALVYNSTNGLWVPGTVSGGGGSVTSVSGTAPIVSSGGATPAISITAASSGAPGSMSASDKSKLDGIESGATGDQTAAELLTAIKTVDGSGSGLDADTLDGHDTAYFQAAGASAGGDLSGTYPNPSVVASSDTVAGKVELATTAETQTGTDTVRAVTPAGAAGTYQPLDSDLTAIAALSTTAYGRAFLALADAAAGRTALGLGTAAVAATGDFDAAGAASTVQTNLTTHAGLTGTSAHGLGTASTHAATDFIAGAGTVVSGRIVTFSGTNGYTVQDSGTALSALLTSATAASTYLPLVGGTMSGSVDSMTKLAVNASTWSTVEKLRVNTPTTADTTANVVLSASATTAKPLVLQGIASQSANYLELQVSSGGPRFTVDANGRITVINGNSVSWGNTDIYMNNPGTTTWFRQSSSSSGTSTGMIGGCNANSAVKFQPYDSTGSAGGVNVLTLSNTQATFADAINIVFNTTTGTKIGTGTTQKLAFWNATPIVQPTTAVTAATLVGGGGTALTDTDTFDGYTVKQVVKALRNTGLLA